MKGQCWSKDSAVRLDDDERFEDLTFTPFRETLCQWILVEAVQKVVFRGLNPSNLVFALYLPQNLDLK